MKPVNLLPGEHRPRHASGRLAGSSYVLVGGLTAVLVLVGLYLVTSNQVVSRENETAKALQQTQAAEAKSASLSAFGDFASVAKTRSASVKQLAGGRFDWERLTRELALVLPERVWLTEVDASVVPASTGAGASESTSSGPAAKLVGCAENQPDVAKLMVRLRQMDRVTDVQLKQSAQGDVGSSTGTTDSSGGASSDCDGLYAFELTVVLEAPPPITAPPEPGSGRVPARLGGGG